MSNLDNPRASIPNDDDKLIFTEHEDRQKPIAKGSQETSFENAGSMAEQTADEPQLVHIDPSPMNDAPAKSGSSEQQSNIDQLRGLSLSPTKQEHLSVQTQFDAPPPPPKKDELYVDPTPKTPQAPRSPLRLPAEYTEKELPSVPQNDQLENQNDVSDLAREGEANDDDQSEIQSIMEQFSDETIGPKETEIMSPRLELAEHFLGQQNQLSARRSSLEPLPKSANSISSSAGTSSLPQPLVIPKAAQNSGAEAPETPQSTSSRTGLPPPEPESDQPFDFHRFLEQLRHRTADPVAKFLRSFLTEFGKKQWLVHEQVKIISDFLAFITNKMAQCEVWRHVSDAEFENAKEGMEKLVMNRLYSQTFSPAIPPSPTVPRSTSRSKRRELERIHGPGRRGQHQEDVERDEILAQKIRIYSWIRPEHLDIPSLGNNGRRFLSLAQQGKFLCTIWTGCD